MSQANISLRSFNGGQVGPRAEGRTDIEQYGTSSRLIKNLIPKVNGSLIRRPGTRYSAAALESNGTSKPSRLIPFQIGDDENYMLELNEYRMRVFKDESPMTYQSRVFSKNELGVEGGAYHFDAEFGHGFYHGQPVTFDGNPYVVPTGFSTSTNYFVVLPEAFRPETSQNVSGATVRLNKSSVADLKLGLGQGPYAIRSDYKKSTAGYGQTPDGGPYYVNAIDTSSNFLSMKTSRTAGSPQVPSGGATPYVHNITVVPLEEAYAKTFQLSTDRTNLRANIVSNGTPAVTGSMKLTPLSEEIIFNTPWSNAEVWQLDFSSGIDRIFFYHENYPPMELNRWNVGAFRLTETPIEHTAVGETAPFGTANSVVIDKIGTGNTNGDPDVADRPNAETDEPRIGEIAVASIGTNFGDTNLTGSAFNVGHVGQTFRWVNSTDGKEVAGSEKVHIVGKTLKIGKVGVNHISIPMVLNDAFFDSEDISGTTITLNSGSAFAVGDPVSFVSGTQSLSGNIVERTVYFVKTVSTNNITVAATSDLLTAITIGSQPGNSHRVINHALVRRRGDATAISLADNFAEGVSKISLAVDGELPTGLLSGVPYRLKALNVGLGRFYLEHWGGEKDGTIPYLTSTGSGRLYVNASANDTVPQCQVRQTIAAGQRLKPSGDDNRVNFDVKTSTYHVGEWGAEKGWPRSGTQYEQRHILAGSISQPNRVWVSETGNDVSWSPYSPIYSRDSGTAMAPAQQRGALIWETLDISGFSFDPLSSSTSNIQWCHGHNILLVATKSEIFEIAASSNREALTPANVNSRIVSTVGSNRIKPVRAGSDVIYVSASSSEISALLFDGVSAASTPQSLTVWSEDVMDSEIRQLAWQNEPIPILWLCREDGVLYGCTYDRDQSVVGWHQHELGGAFDGGIPKVRSVATVRYDATNERDSYDRLWMSVSRTVAGAEVQYIEWMTPGLMDWEESTSAVYLDCCPAPKSGLNTTDPYGAGEASHLKNDTVGQWVKSHSSSSSEHARYLGTATIASNGSLPTLGGTVSHCTIGYTYNSEYSSLPLEAVADTAGSEATIQGFRKRIVDAWVRLHRSHDGAISSQLSSDQSQRTPLGNEDLGTAATPPFTGVVSLRGFQHEWNEEATFNLLVEPAVPFELLSVVCRVDWSER